MTGPAANARYYDLHREAILAKRRAKRAADKATARRAAMKAARRATPYA